MPSRIDTAGHTKAFDYPVAEHWAESRTCSVPWDSNRPHIGPQWVVGRGSWVVGRGSWVVGRGSWVVGRGSWVVGRGSWVVGRGSWGATPRHAPQMSKSHGRPAMLDCAVSS